MLGVLWNFELAGTCAFLHIHKLTCPSCAVKLCKTQDEEGLWCNACINYPGCHKSGELALGTLACTKQHCSQPSAMPRGLQESKAMHLRMLTDSSLLEMPDKQLVLRACLHGDPAAASTHLHQAVWFVNGAH